MVMPENEMLAPLFTLYPAWGDFSAWRCFTNHYVECVATGNQTLVLVNTSQQAKVLTGNTRIYHM